MNRKNWIALFVTASLVAALLVGVSQSVAALEEKGNQLELVEQTFRGDTWTYRCSIEQTSDKGYILNGCLSYIQKRDLYRVDLIVKIDENGSEEWRKVSAPRRVPQTRGSPSAYREGTQLVSAPEATPTPIATPTPTPTPPGFEAVYAITGLLAIAYLLRQRRN